MLSLHTLGRFELVRTTSQGSDPIPVQPKRLALLTYLCLSSPTGPVRRDTLLALFWPESTTEEARRSLRQALFNLRNVLGEGVLISATDDSLIVTDGMWCDALALSAARDEATCEERLDLYAGEFLRGVHVPEVSPDLEQWIAGTRAQLRNEANAAAWQLVTRQEEEGTPAAETARRAVELAPDDEPGIRRLLSLLHRNGDRLGALRVYDDMTRRLQEEFEATPAPETAALIARLFADDTSAGPPPVQLPAPPNGPTKPRSSRRRLALIGTTLLLVLAGGSASLAWFSPPDSVAPGVHGSLDRILVAEFRNQTSDSLLARAISDAFRVDLAQSRSVTVLGSQQVEAALRRMKVAGVPTFTDSLAREVALREGAKAYVAGSVGMIGSTYVLTADLVSAAEGEVLASFRQAAADSSSLLTALDALGERIRRSLGESLATIRSALPIERATTASLDALRQYSAAIHAADREGDPRRALQLLRLAIERDSSFAMAWRSVSAVALNLGDPSTAALAARRAFELGDRLSDRERYSSRGHYFLINGQPAEAIEAYTALLGIYPRSFAALGNMAYIYGQSRDYPKAEHFSRLALAADSTSPLVFTHLAGYLINQNKLAAADSLVGRLRQMYPDFGWEVGVSLAIARGDLAGAAREAREALARQPDDYERRWLALHAQLNISLMRGQLVDAERSLQLLLESARRQQIAADQMEVAGWLGVVAARFRHAPLEGLDAIEQALRGLDRDSTPRGNSGLAWLAYGYARAGRPDHARKLLGPDPVTGGNPGRGDDAERLRVQGVTLVAERRAREAVALLRRADGVHDCPICVLPDLANAYDLSGQADSAIAVYQRYLTTPWAERVYIDGAHLGHAWLRLAQLRGERGDHHGAREAYRALVSLWGEADPILQPAVAGARAQLAEMGG